ncbi:MAG: polysaccharide deacetylase family protein [Candidatus Phosphoribacter sp.]
MPAPREAKVITVLATSAKVIALTFDGGADSGGAASILSTLSAQGVMASFFVTGRFAQSYPSLTAQLAKVGPVGNHSWDHPHFPALTDQAALTQLDRTRSTILAAAGADPRPFFRFPFGDSDARTRSLVGNAGYVAVGWTVDSVGWKGTSGGLTATSVADRVVAAAKPGAIVLMHLGAHPDDHTTLDADALPSIITRLRALGYSFVTLGSLR